MNDVEELKRAIKDLHGLKAVHVGSQEVVGGLVKRCVKSIQAAFPSLPFDIVSITPFRQRLPV